MERVQLPYRRLAAMSTDQAILRAIPGQISRVMCPQISCGLTVARVADRAVLRG